MESKRDRAHDFSAIKLITCIALGRAAKLPRCRVSHFTCEQVATGDILVQLKTASSVCTRAARPNDITRHKNRSRGWNKKTQPRPLNGQPVSDSRQHHNRTRKFAFRPSKQPVGFSLVNVAETPVRHSMQQHNRTRKLAIRHSKQPSICTRVAWVGGGWLAEVELVEGKGETPGVL